MSSHIALFDIGNTALKIGFCRFPRREEPMAVYSLPTDAGETPDGLGLRLSLLAEHAGVTDVMGGLVCSVVPAMNPVLEKACGRFLGCSTRFVGRDVETGLENAYERPAEVGADRLVTAYAASVLYAKPAYIVVDFGTATTFDCVLGKSYLGGLICPGVLSSAQALAARTAKLPQVDLDLQDDMPVIGRSTRQSLNHGLIFGFAAMVEGVAQRLKATPPLAGAEVMVIGAGGLAETIARVSSVFDAVRSDLLLEGLIHLYTECTER